jgi:hypothetical protein
MSKISPEFSILTLLLCLLWPACNQDIFTDIPVIEDEKFKYGAHTNPTGDAIGGGGCYSAHVQEGDYLVRNRRDLLSALETAQAGEVILVEHDASIDLSNDFNINIPAGVTLAGDRGNCAPENEGPLIYLDDMPEGKGLFWLRAGSRVTGLRFRGPDADYPDVDYNVEPPSWNKCLVAWGQDIEIDNCEISNFHHSGVSVNNGGSDVHIHHNYLHDIHAYPIITVNHSDYSVIIEANTIEWIWHTIASTGHPGTGYEAKYNMIVRKPAPDSWQPYLGGHAIDMHQYVPVQQDRGHLIGGDLVKIHHNTFASEAGADPSLDMMFDAHIRGVPRILAEFHNNCFLNADPAQAVVHSEGNTWVHNNLYGVDSTHIMIAEETTPQILFRSPPPPNVDVPELPGESLSVDIKIHLMEPMQLDSVVIELDGEAIYSGANAPGPGELNIALCELDSNLPYHELRVIATDNRGVVGQHLSAFRAACL